MCSLCDVVKTRN